MSLYKAIWSRIGGRPWTYITRDLWREVEYFFIVGLFSIGFFAGAFFPILWFYFIKHPLMLFVAGLVLFTLGYISGHIFWGSRYRPGQKGK